MIPWFTKKVRLLRWFALAAAIGVVLLIVGTTYAQWEAAFIFGLLFVTPFFILATIIPIWHWKERYRGARSNLWGAILVLETSGVVRIVYWIRHVMEDRWGKGRYSDKSSEQQF